MPPPLGPLRRVVHFGPDLTPHSPLRSFSTEAPPPVEATGRSISSMSARPPRAPRLGALLVTVLFGQLTTVRCDDDTRWRLGAPGDSCDDTCAGGAPITTCENSRSEALNQARCGTYGNTCWDNLRPLLNFKLSNVGNVNGKCAHIASNNIGWTCRNGVKTTCAQKSGSKETGNRRVCCCLRLGAGDNPADASDWCPMLLADCKSAARAWSPGGKVCVKRSSGCPLGEWLNETHAPVQCIRCLSARYGIAAAQVTRDAACAACPPGKMSIAGSTSCSTCVAGKWADPQNKKECVKCAKGWYLPSCVYPRICRALHAHTHAHLRTPHPCVHTHVSRKVW